MTSNLARCAECGVATRILYTGGACSMACVQRQVLRRQIEELRYCVEELVAVANRTQGKAAEDAVERASQVLHLTRPEDR